MASSEIRTARKTAAAAVRKNAAKANGWSSEEILVGYQLSVCVVLASAGSYRAACEFADSCGWVGTGHDFDEMASELYEGYGIRF